MSWGVPRFGISIDANLRPWCEALGLSLASSRPVHGYGRDLTGVFGGITWEQWLLS